MMEIYTTSLGYGECFLFGGIIYVELPFDGTVWKLWRMIVLICREGGHQLDDDVQLCLFTFTCGSHGIRPKGSFQILVLLCQVDYMEDKLAT